MCTSHLEYVYTIRIHIHTRYIDILYIRHFLIHIYAIYTDILIYGISKYVYISLS